MSHPFVLHKEQKMQVTNPLPFWLKGPTLVQGGRFLNCPSPRALNVRLVPRFGSPQGKMANDCLGQQDWSSLGKLSLTCCPEPFSVQVYECHS